MSERGELFRGHKVKGSRSSCDLSSKVIIGLCVMFFRMVICQVQWHLTLVIWNLPSVV